jgi:hypothetical protein
MASSSDPRQLTPEVREDYLAWNPSGSEITAIAPSVAFTAGWLAHARRSSSPAPDTRSIEAADAALLFLSGVEELLHQEGADDGLANVLTQLEAVASSPVPDSLLREVATRAWNLANEREGCLPPAQCSVDVERVLAAVAPVSVGDEPGICGVICNCGPNGEPMACGYEKGHEPTAHSWASLPTWTERWRIVHNRHTDPKKSSMAIEGPATNGSQIVYGVAMDRGVPAHERGGERG